MDVSRYQRSYPELRPKMVSETYFTSAHIGDRSTHAQEWNKPRGLPDLGEQMTTKSEPEVVGKQTPYRLPRLRAEPPAMEEREQRVWSRHGYQLNTHKPADIEAMISEKNMSPREASQHLRQLGLMYPKFQSAMISPAPRYSVHQPQTSQSLPCPVQSSIPEDSLLDEYLGGATSPFPPTRTSSPAKSAHSIHWTLSPFKNLHFDKKGRGRVQGPYSREFTVTCSAPSNWLRMKWGRSKTTLV